MEETRQALKARYRTIKDSYAEIKQADPDTVISEYFIRQLCKSGEIAYRQSGSKIFVNLDSLIGYLNGEPP